MSELQGRKLRAAYDYIVVGSGSAGAVVAARLAENPHVSVLLMEAGPRDNSIFIKMPAALGFPLMNDKYNWYLHSEPEPGLNGRTVYEARGRVLGGSSSINGMNWVRGNPWDYDEWARLGNKGWSFAEVLPYFKRAETFAGGSDAYRGGSGPMRIERCQARNPLYQAFLAAGQEYGLPLAADHNGFKQEGVHVTQRNVHNGLRWSTSRAYLHEGPVRSNLHVLTGAFAQRIQFSHRRATGLAYLHEGQVHTVEARSEVILCGGALHSPHLLLHSGIGQAQHLRKLGIQVVADVPGVGEGLKDHLAAPVQYRATQNVSAARDLTLLGRLKLGAEWLFLKKGIGATNFFEVGAFLRTHGTEPAPNVQFEFVPMLGELQHGGVKLENGFQYFFSLMRPTSTGRVWIDQADPRQPPKFVFNFLTTPEDQRDAIAAVKIIRKIVDQSAWDPLRGEETTPGANVRSDAEILAFLRQTAGTNYHPCCTCRMGADDLSVVDAAARVHQTEGLRVVDASIMPTIVSGNLNAPVIMMAERVADLVRGVASLPADEAPYHRYAEAAVAV